MPSLDSNRKAKARRFVLALRRSWEAHPIAGMPSLLVYASLLEDKGWTDVAEQAGENVPSPETRNEILRQIALGEWVGALPEPRPLAVVR